MAEITTATVKLLQAEVRVLLVGNRQVSLSMAKQLDHAPLEEIEPFGRLKLPGLPRGVSYCAVGRHKSTGALVLSRRPAHEWVTKDSWEPGEAPTDDEIKEMNQETNDLLEGYATAVRALPLIVLAGPW
jgi:hypothetical protein